MTSMPTPVNELKKRDEASFPVRPGTNEEEALRFLAANPDLGWTPKEIAAHTTIAETSITKTMDRLHEKTLVDRVQGMYFVKPERLDEIQGVLGDLHTLRAMAGEKSQKPVHPEQRTARNEREEDVEYTRASETEVDGIVQDTLDEGAKE